MSDRYAVVIEKGETSYGAYALDLPGCIAVAATKPEVEKLIAEAITLHIESVRQHGNPLPAPISQIGYIEPAAVA